MLREEAIPEAGGLTTTTRAHPNPPRNFKGVVKGRNIIQNYTKLQVFLLGNL